MDVKDLFGLTGKNVAITGSASGMNRAATDGEDVFEAPLMVFRKSATLNGWEATDKVCAARCGAHQVGSVP
ncbi:MAG: hypothetical protein IKG18_00970 [Atopobiaceae bacterium]|nr:hypothetical protein [Atopobiaceae bacterium]